MKTNKPMIEYLATCSKISLQSFELARLNERANLRKHLVELLDELIEVDIQARIAEWILVHRAGQADMRRTPRRSRRSDSNSTPTQKLLLPLAGPNATVADFLEPAPNRMLPALNPAAVEPSRPVRRAALPSQPEKSKRIA